MHEQAVEVARVEEAIHPVAVIQDEPLGVGVLWGLTESALGADEDYFAVMLPDDVIEPTVAMSEMIRVCSEHGGLVLVVAGDVPSILAATRRYLLDREIFDALRRITPGKGAELRFTDAIALLISEGHPVHVVVHDGIRHEPRQSRWLHCR